MKLNLKQSTISEKRERWIGRTLVCTDQDVCSMKSIGNNVLIGTDRMKYNTQFRIFDRP